jgi:hypothetical protein
VCTTCAAAKYSTALGYTGPCTPWKACQPFIEIEDDSKPANNAADKVCMAYQYDPPRGIKMFLFFGMFISCGILCLLFVRLAPQCCFPKSSRFMLHSIRRDFSELKSKLASSCLIAPVQKSLIGSFHDFVVGIHDVVSDLSLLVLVAPDGPAYFSKTRGELYYIVVFAVLSSFICDVITAASCGELHLLWLYMASCTEIVPSRRGRVSYLNKILKFMVESIPIWFVQGVFIFQTYMKYQFDRASTTSMNATNATALSVTPNNSTATSTANTENSDRWLDYGIVFLSLLGTVGNILKNVFSIRRMVQYDWNHVEEFKNIELKEGKVFHKAPKSSSTWKSRLISVFRQLRMLPQHKDRVEMMEIQHSKEILSDLQFLKTFVSPYQKGSDPGNLDTHLIYPVFAYFQIQKKGPSADTSVGAIADTALESDPITFVYVLEISGETGHSNTCMSSFSTVFYEIREYYHEKDAWKTKHMSLEDDKDPGFISSEWIANEPHNPCVHPSQSKLHENMFKLSLLENKKKEISFVKAYYDDLGYELVMPGDVSNTAVTTRNAK